MTITFYNNYSEDNKIHKEISDELSFEGTLRDEEVSLSNPTIRFKLNNDILTKNYCYIPEFRRYYYVVNFSIIRNEIVEVTLKSDVLMSFWEEFKGNAAYVDKSRDYGNFYLVDENLPVQQNTKIERRVIHDTPFKGTSIIMNALNTAYRTPTEEANT